MIKKALKKLIMAITLTSIFMVTLPCNPIYAAVNSLSWKIHSATALHSTNTNWTFAIGDYNGDGIDDLYTIYKSGSNQNSKVLLHILNGADNFQSYLEHKELSINLDEHWEFNLGDYNKDGKPDLYCVLKSISANKATELHVLDGASGYTSFSVHQTLPIMKSDSNWTFKVADGDRDGRSDVYGIQTAATGSKMTEVHALSASTNFQSYFLHEQTGFRMLGDNWDFGFGDFNNDNIVDLYGICKNGTGSGQTEVHVLNGYGGLKQFLLQSRTLLQSVDSDRFQMIIGNGRLNIYAIQRDGSPTNKTEVHLMGYDDVNPLDVKRDKIVKAAKSHLGIKYVYGGSDTSGFDCSGLVQYVYKEALGINLSRTTFTQINEGVPVSISDLKPGDLVFPSNHHVQIYIGNGQVIHAPQTGDVVKISNLSTVWQARRIIN